MASIFCFLFLVPRFSLLVLEYSFAGGFSAIELFNHLTFLLLPRSRIQLIFKQPAVNFAGIKFYPS